MRRVVPLLFAALLATPAAGQSPEFMMNECSSAGQTYFRDFNAATQMQYNGQRVDGTHAVNGRIYLETRYEDFSCSYDRSGRQMVSFFAQGRTQASPLPGGGGSSPGAGGDVLRVTGLSANDVLNVRSGPGTSYRIIGALGNGDRVRRLRCETPGSTTWCEIEMLTDMRERGWVSARYLSGGGASQGAATQLPSAPAAGPGQVSTVTVRFPAGASGAQITEELLPGATRRYVLGARNRQTLSFRLATDGPGLSYRILNPDGSVLLGEVRGDQEYRGELWQSGNHVIEVINRGGRRQSYTAVFRIN